MTASVEPIFISVLLVVGLPSSGGIIGESQNLLQELVFSRALIANKDEVELQGGRRQDLIFQPETNIPGRQGTYHEPMLQEYFKGTEKMRMQDRIQTEKIRKYHLDSKVQTYSNSKLALRPKIDAKIGDKTEHKGYVQIHEQNSLKTRLKNQIWLTVRKHERQNDENVVLFLWKRGAGQSSMTYEAESSPRNTEFQPNNASSPTLRGKNVAGSDVPSPTKQKNSFLRFIRKNVSTSRNTSSDKSRKTSKPEGLGTQLTSGYAEKPSGVGLTREYNPVSPQPRAGQNVSDDVWPHMSPAKSPEVNQMWDFINRRSKQWSNEDSSLPSGDNQQPGGAGNNKQPISQPSGRTASKSFQNTKPNGSPSKRQSPPARQSEPPKMPRNAGQQSSESKVDKDARHTIKRHKKGWESAEGVPAKNASSSSSDSDSHSKKNQGPNSSQPPAPVRFSAQHPPSRSGKPLQHMTNRELNEQYEAYITRVRSESFEGERNNNV